MLTSKLENYRSLLAIRRAGRLRDTRLAGGIFLLAFLSMLALGLLDRLTGRSLYLVSALVVVFGFGYLAAWVRLEIIKGTLELIDNM